MNKFQQKQFFGSILTAIALANLGAFTGLAPLRAEDPDQVCTARRLNTHACLPERPTYSYHLGVPSDYAQALCLDLGQWQGTNTILITWDGVQQQLNLSGSDRQLLAPSVRQGQSSSLVLYSELPINPEMQTTACSSSHGNITAFQWSEATRQHTPQVSSNRRTSADPSLNPNETWVGQLGEKDMQSSNSGATP